MRGVSQGVVPRPDGVYFPQRPALAAPADSSAVSPGFGYRPNLSKTVFSFPKLSDVYKPDFSSSVGLREKQQLPLHRGEGRGRGIPMTLLDFWRRGCSHTKAGGRPCQSAASEESEGEWISWGERERFFHYAAHRSSAATFRGLTAVTPFQGPRLCFRVCPYL